MKSSLTQHQQLVFGITYSIVIVFVLLDAHYHFLVMRYPFEVLLKPGNLIETNLRQLSLVPTEFVHTVFRSERMIADLQIKNAQLQAQVAEAENAKKENELLKKELEKNTESNQDLFTSVLTARIIEAGVVTYLDKGVSNGVVSGGLVMSQQVLLGKIQSSDHFFSSVGTFSQGSWQTVAKTQTGVKGIVTGKKGQVLFTQVSADQKLEKGDELYTLGSISDQVPPGLYLGQVQDMLEDVGAPVQTAIVDQGVNIESLSLVLIKMRE
ncbi:MAG: rod shape-determining protein MreC [Patescibacteria group bacterium]